MVNPTSRSSLVGTVVPVVIGLILLAMAPGCGKPSQAASPPPAKVTVSRPIERQVIQWDEYAGNLSSPDMANVSARVSGLVEKTSFQEGSIVHKGDVLFVIDPRPFQADLDAKKSAVAQAQAQADQAAVHLRRYTEVRSTKAISAEDYDTAKAANEEAQAALGAAKAAMENSELNLQWTKVTAPITGRISRMNVQAGNLVTGGSNGSGGGAQPTLLTTIVSIDPMYCYVQVPEANAIRYQKLSLQQKGADIAHARIPCYLQLSGESGFPHAGAIDFIDNQVDTGTGTVSIRGVFANPKGLLTPGMFARLRVPGTARYSALLIPDAAINSNQNERFVLLVDADDVVRQRPVVLGPMFGNLRQIDDGLTLSDLVVVNGVQKARPGAKVEPHEAPVRTESLAAMEATDKSVPTSETQPAGMLNPSGSVRPFPSPGTPGEGEGGGSPERRSLDNHSPDRPLPNPPPAYRGRENSSSTAAGTQASTQPASGVLQPVQVPPVTSRPGSAGEAR
jgi:multidrug efflux system membrane fusion protein